jgi:hypothetical protein
MKKYLKIATGSKIRQGNITFPNVKKNQALEDLVHRERCESSVARVRRMVLRMINVLKQNI